MPRDDERTYPETDYELKKGADLAGRARLSYYDSEMDEEGVPTIQLLEIRKGLRRRGYGRRMLEAIEFDMKDMFFPKIWATNMQDYGFWESMDTSPTWKKGGRSWHRPAGDTKVPLSIPPASM